LAGGVDTDGHVVGKVAIEVVLPHDPSDHIVMMVSAGVNVSCISMAKLSV
jgi:hypothetical protein